MKHSTWLRVHRDLRLLACGSLGGRVGAPVGSGPQGREGRPGYEKSIRILSVAQGTSRWSLGRNS